MKFTVASGKTQRFKGQITKYDGLTGKYRVDCPCDGETVYVYPMTTKAGRARADREQHKVA